MNRSFKKKNNSKRKNKKMLHLHKKKSIISLNKLGRGKILSRKLTHKQIKAKNKKKVKGKLLIPAVFKLHFSNKPNIKKGRKINK